MDTLKYIVTYLTFIVFMTAGCYVSNFGKNLHQWSDGSKNLLGASIAIGGIMLIAQITYKKNSNDPD